MHFPVRTEERTDSAWFGCVRLGDGARPSDNRGQGSRTQLPARKDEWSSSRRGTRFARTRDGCMPPGKMIASCSSARNSSGSTGRIERCTINSLSCLSNIENIEPKVMIS